MVQKNLVVSMSETTRERLKEFSRERLIAVSKIVERAVQQFLDSRESERDPLG